jgi:hypothetical protein
MVGGEVCYGCNSIRHYTNVSVTAPEPLPLPAPALAPHGEAVDLDEDEELVTRAELEEVIESDGDSAYDALAVGMAKLLLRTHPAPAARVTSERLGFAVWEVGSPCFADDEVNGNGPIYTEREEAA